MSRHLALVFAFTGLSLLQPVSLWADGPRTLDLATFTPPAGWSDQSNATMAGYSHLDKSGASYCQLMVHKSVASSGDARADFDQDWQTLIAKRYGATQAPAKLSRPARKGWTVHAGSTRAKLTDHTADITLTTYSGHGAVVSIVTVGNHKRCPAAIKKMMKSLVLKPPAAAVSGSDKAEKGAPAAPAAPIAASPASGFQFVTSNFDDGWVASIQPDWVEVSKGDIQVALYYTVPYESDRFTGTGVVARDYYWDNYVTRQFNLSSKAYRDDGEVIGSLKPLYVEGWGTDRKTGQRRFVAMVMAISPNAAMLTVASAPTEAAMRQQFPKANDRYTSDLAAMSRYNKFAVGAQDLVGAWQSGGSQSLQWYDSRTGAYAGATLAASSATFTFAADGSYRSIHNGATGAVGAMNTFQQNYKGSYKAANWQVTATKRYEGRTDTFDAHFQVVRGGRLLFLDDKRGGSYLLVRVAK